MRRRARSGKSGLVVTAERRFRAATGPVGELELIAGIRREFKGAGRPGRAVALGIGDDCAILRPPPGTEVLLTTDMTLEGRHFRRDLHPAESVGHRCLARGLSDLAAMGARPMAAFLSLALPTEMLRERAGRVWVARFLEGLRALAERAGVPLAGGDTAEGTGGLVMADIVLTGTAPVGRSLRRSGARAGDGLYVTGALGGAAAELADMFTRGSGDRTARALRRWEKAEVQVRHPQMFPQPRLRLGETLRRRGLATACVDLSDGLSTDVRHLAEASGVAVEIEVSVLPVHGLAALASGDVRRLTMDGGEDYELLFTAAAGVRVPRSIGGVAVTRIGRVVRERKGRPVVTGVEADGSRVELRARGWEHFSGGQGVR